MTIYYFKSLSVGITATDNEYSYLFKNYPQNDEDTMLEVPSVCKFPFLVSLCCINVLGN